MPSDVLFTFVGNHDPVAPPPADEDAGPVLSLLRVRYFAHLVLFVSTGRYAERAHVIQRVAQREGYVGTISFVELELSSPVDYEELWSAMNRAIGRAEQILPAGSARRFVLLDPGTPQMQTVWFLMVHSGAFHATLLQGIPARFNNGTYRCREVHVNSERLPVRSTVTGTTTVHGDRSGEERSGDERAAPDGARGVRVTGSHRWLQVGSPIIGESPAIRAAVQLSERVAPYDSVVLITGEPGTGKELIARRIHAASTRATGPFVPINAAALSPNLIESELFGHRRGAFTGATTDRPGAFRAAAGGTLFLDEVGDLRPDVQARLLRALEYGEITPVGEDTPQPVDTRVIAATNRDLDALVATGDFRADLLARLRETSIALPPLAERPGDIRILAEAFVSEWNDQSSATRELSPDVWPVLEGHEWRGNVRELRNVIRQLCMLSDEARITGAALSQHLTRPERLGMSADADGTTAPEGHDPAPPAGVHASPTATDATTGSITRESWPPGTAVDLPQILVETERRWFREALAREPESKAAAAKLLGLNPPAFRRALRERFADLNAQTPE